MANQFSRGLQYEDLDEASPDIQESNENFDTKSSEENTGFYTFYIPEESDADQLELWTALLDAAWAVREPLASIPQKGIYRVMRSIMAHAYFDMPAAAIADHCRILCMKLGIRCNPNYFCAHYQGNADSERVNCSKIPDEPVFKRPKEPQCKLSTDEDPLIK